MTPKQSRLPINKRFRTRLDPIGLLRSMAACYHAAMHVRRLHDSPLVRIFDVRCRPDRPECGEEEHAAGNHVVFPRRGVFVRHVRGQKIVADPGQVLFFTAGESYRVSHPVSGGDDCTSFAFDHAVLLEAATAADPRVQDRPEAPFACSHHPATPHALLPQRALRYKLRKGEAGTLEVEETALAVLGEVMRLPDAGGRPRPRRQRAVTARLRRDWIEATRLTLAERPEADPTLAVIARRVGCSPFHLARLFRASQGIPIHQYQLRLRLALALERLLDGSTNLLALALDLGFASHSHFSAAFRRAFGTTPSAFRRAATRRRLAEMRKILTV